MEDLSDNVSEPADELVRMLVVEDGEPCRRALQRVLRARGYTVVAVESAEAAIELLATGDASMGFIVVDVDLPGMCGLDLVRHVQVTNPGIRPLLVTAADRVKVQRFCTKYDVEYFPKPLDVKGFLHAIGQAHA